MFDKELQKKWKHSQETICKSFEIRQASFYFSPLALKKFLIDESKLNSSKENSDQVA